MDRADVVTSPAYHAMTVSGVRMLHLIADEIARSGNGVAKLSYRDFVARGICKSAAHHGVQQLVRLGFVKVEVGVCRRASVFKLCGDWQRLGANEARRQVSLARLSKAGSSLDAVLSVPPLPWPDR